MPARTSGPGVQTRGVGGWAQPTGPEHRGGAPRCRYFSGDGPASTRHSRRRAGPGAFAYCCGELDPRRPGADRQGRGTADEAGPHGPRGDPHRGRGRPPVRLARRPQARGGARSLRDRRRRPPLPRRRRLDRRLHRLPVAARGRRVVALDVGRGQLDWGLRNDERVVAIEGFNARELTPADLPFAPELVTVDVSFISVAKLLPAIASVAAADARILAMVKPQFELGRGRVGRGGVVRDPAAAGRGGARASPPRPGAVGLQAAGSRPPACPARRATSRSSSCSAPASSRSPTSPSGQQSNPRDRR